MNEAGFGFCPTKSSITSGIRWGRPVPARRERKENASCKTIKITRIFLIRENDENVHSYYTDYKIIKNGGN